MTTENLQKLIATYNSIYNITVTGDAIIPPFALEGKEQMKKL